MKEISKENEQDLKKMEEVCKEEEWVLLRLEAENNEFESELTESNGGAQELQGELEEDTHLGDAGKINSEGTIAELQTNPELMAGGKELLSNVNEDLITEVLPLKEQYAELVECTSSLPETENVRDEELGAEFDRLLKHYEESNERIRGLWETDLQEMEEKKRELESLNGKAVMEKRELEEKHSELTKEKEEQGRTIESLQGEVASLLEENSLFSLRLDETGEMPREILHNCLQNYGRVMGLEYQSINMLAKLDAATLAYGEATVELNQIKKERSKLLNDLQKIQGEKEVLDKELMLQGHRNKALEEQLLLTRSSLNEMKESASREKQQIENLKNQILEVSKNAQISDIQSQRVNMAKESRSGLVDTVKNMDVHTRPTPRNVNEKQKPGGTEIRKPNRVDNRKPAAAAAKNVPGKGKPSSSKNRF